MFSLKGKKALVTGASRGIGKGIALELAKAGADVAVNFHSSRKEAEKVVKQIKKLGRISFSVQADVSDETQVKNMFLLVKKKFKRLDILVNNAGVLDFSPLDKMTDKQWNKVLDTDLKGQFHCAREAVKIMKKQKKGKIINIASVASGQVGVGFPSLAHYCAAKGGVVALTEEMALELGKYNINVNSIAPGAIDTDMIKSVKTDKKQLQGILARIPKGRLGNPEDIGSAVVFLASDEADYVTGVMLPVDGGWLSG